MTLPTQPIGPKTPQIPPYKNKNGDIDVAKLRNELAIFDAMKKFDKNGDGKIDKSEQAAYEAAALVDQYDDDHNGVFNDRERAAYEAAKKLKDQEEKPEKTDIDVAEKTKELEKLKAMMEFDKNHDGIIDKSEQAAYEAAALVDQYDEDHDGNLNDKERASYEAAKKSKEEEMAKKEESPKAEEPPKSEEPSKPAGQPVKGSNFPVFPFRYEPTIDPGIVPVAKPESDYKDPGFGVFPKEPSRVYDPGFGVFPKETTKLKSGGLRDLLKDSSWEVSEETLLQADYQPYVYFYKDGKLMARYSDEFLNNSQFFK